MKSILSKILIELGNIWFRFDIPKEKIPKKIIIFTCPGIGDALMLTASVHQLRKKYTIEQIDVQCFKQTYAIWKNNPDINNIIIGDRDIKTLIKLRKNKYDLAICFRFFTTPLFAYLCGIPMRRGPYKGREGFALTQKVPNYSGGYALNHHANIADVEPGQEMVLILDEEDCDIIPNGITVIPDAGTTPTAMKKMWPAEYFAELCNMIGRHVTILGMNRQQSNKMINSLKVPYTDYTGLEGVGKFCGMIKNSKLVICNDSAAMHVASCFNVPCTAIFGPTDINFLAHKNIIAINNTMNCQPCFNDERIYNCNHQDCLKLLKPETVYNKVVTILK